VSGNSTLDLLLGEAQGLLGSLSPQEVAALDRLKAEMRSVLGDSQDPMAAMNYLRTRLQDPSVQAILRKAIRS